MTGVCPMVGVILAAGFGTRMASLTTLAPKPLLPIVNVPTLERILSAFHAAGVRETLIITGYKAEAIESFCGDGGQWGMRLFYERQTTVSGTGSATRFSSTFVGDRPFLLTYGDILLEAHEYSAVVRIFEETGCEAVSALNRMEDVSKGSANYLEGRRIVKVVEKPPPGTAGTNLNSAGLYAFRPEIFQAIDRTPKSERGEYELTEAVQTMIAEGRVVMGHPLDGPQYDIGTPEAFLATNVALIETFNLRNVSPDQVDSDNFASPHVALTPPVAVHPETHLERCRIGPGVCIDAGTRIGHGASLDNAVILEGADIGDGASISFAIIGRQSRVSNRMILHGAPDKVLVVGDREEAE